MVSGPKKMCFHAPLPKSGTLYTPYEVNKSPGRHRVGTRIFGKHSFGKLHLRFYCVCCTSWHEWDPGLDHVPLNGTTSLVGSHRLRQWTGGHRFFSSSSFVCFEARSPCLGLVFLGKPKGHGTETVRKPRGSRGENVRPWRRTSSAGRSYGKACSREADGGSINTRTGGLD